MLSHCRAWRYAAVASKCYFILRVGASEVECFDAVTFGEAIERRQLLPVVSAHVEGEVRGGARRSVGALYGAESVGCCALRGCQVLGAYHAVRQYGEKDMLLAGAIDGAAATVAALLLASRRQRAARKRRFIRADSHLLTPSIDSM